MRRTNAWHRPCLWSLRNGFERDCSRPSKALHDRAVTVPSRIFRSFLVLALLVVAGCGGDDAQTGTGGAAGSGGGSAGQAGGAGVGGQAGSAGLGGGGAGGSAGVGADEALFEKVLDGSLAAQDGLFSIARAGGFPIPTASGYLFARLADGGGPYRLAGDATGWNEVAMNQQAGVYWTKLVIAAPDGSKYKFVDGQGAFAADPLARRYGYDEFGEHSLVMASAPHRERFPAVSGLGLPARTVRAWVPGSTVTHHLYVNDGQNLWEPDSIFGGWKLNETLGSATLAIGIDNAGAERMNEYTHIADDIGQGPVGGKGDAYADYVEQSVRPLVEARYGTPQRVGVMGSSLGGLIALHQALRHPGRYDFAASLSGTLGWGSIGPHQETMIERQAKAGKQSTKIFLDSGGSAGSGCVDTDQDGIMDDAVGAKDNYCETLQMQNTLSGLGYVDGTDAWHWWEPNAAHNEAAWAARVWRPVAAFEAL